MTPPRLQRLAPRLAALTLAVVGILAAACHSTGMPPSAGKPGEGNLVVEVVEHETGKPIPGLTLTLEPVQLPEEFFDRELQLALLREHQSRVTDEFGKARFWTRLPRGYSVQGQLDREPFPHLVQGIPGDPAVARVPLAPRTVKVEVSTALDRPVRGRVVQGEGGAPIAGAVLRTIHEGSTKDDLDSSPVRRYGQGTVSAADGSFELRVNSRVLARIAVEAPGFKPRVAMVWPESGGLSGLAPGVPQASGPGAEPLAFEVPLAPVEHQMLRVRDARGSPLAGIEVCVRSNESLPFPGSGADRTPRVVDDLCVFGRTGADGNVWIPQPTPWSTLELSRDGRRLLRVDHAPSTLQGNLEFTLEDPARLTGFARDPQGRPEVGVELCLFDGGLYGTGRIENQHRPVDRTTTAADGSFAFEGVAPGTWVVGPNYDRRATLECDPAAPAPVGSVLVLEGGQPPPPVEVTLWRGRYIGGRVLDDQGLPLSRASVFLWNDESRYFQGHSFEDGSFLLGPLPGGTFRVGAGGDGAWAATEMRNVRSGELAHELRLDPAAGVLLRPVNPAGELLRDVQLTLQPHSEFGGAQESSWPSGWAEDQTGWRFASLRAGSYDILARKPTERTIAAVRVELGRGERRAIDLVLAPAAELRIQNRRADLVRVEYRVDGGMIESVELPPGAWVGPLLCPGTCELSVTTQGGEALPQARVELSAGLTAEFDVR